MFYTQSTLVKKGALKVGTNEKVGGSGRLQMIGIYRLGTVVKDDLLSFNLAAILYYNLLSFPLSPAQLLSDGAMAYSLRSQEYSHFSLVPSFNVVKYSTFVVKYITFETFSICDSPSPNVPLVSRI
jgi:hypothetical protein